MNFFFFTINKSESSFVPISQTVPTLFRAPFAINSLGKVIYKLKNIVFFFLCLGKSDHIRGA